MKIKVLVSLECQSEKKKWKFQLLVYEQLSIDSHALIVDMRNKQIE
jgi:hypothetical protein